MDNGWQSSASAWIADMGEHGDFGRRYVLDPVMLLRALARSPKNALDVGCGEGRFCRMLSRHGVDVVGVDPTAALIATARARAKSGVYLEAPAERLPFGDATFDLVVSYPVFRSWEAGQGLSPLDSVAATARSPPHEPARRTAAATG